jgi:hypothetical protein
MLSLHLPHHRLGTHAREPLQDLSLLLGPHLPPSGRDGDCMRLSAGHGYAVRKQRRDFLLVYTLTLGSVSPSPMRHLRH